MNSKTDCDRDSLSEIAIHKFHIYWHPDCEKHEISAHVEQPKRVSDALELLKSKYSKDYFIEASRATMDHILLFHTVNHYNYMEKLFSKIDKGLSTVEKIDGDTKVMKCTREASFRAIGAVISAIDDIYGPQEEYIYSRRSFCCVRPPGHHAERGKAGGFCYFNNVGIGAKYAQSRYGVGKVAVLDFDVHHGNGTEEGFVPFEDLFYGSTHEFGAYPGTGKDPSPYVGESAKNPLHRRIVNRYLRNPLSSRKDFILKWKEILDEMVLFGPELIFISAGFDAHDEDPLSNIMLLEEDYTIVTKMILQACYRLSPNSSRGIPIISVLEGGYDLPALCSSIEAHVSALDAGVEGLTEEEKSEALGRDVAVGDEVSALTRDLELMGIFEPTFANISNISSSESSCNNKSNDLDDSSIQVKKSAEPSADS